MSHDQEIIAKLFMGIVGDGCLLFAILALNTCWYRHELAKLLRRAGRKNLVKWLSPRLPPQPWFDDPNEPDLF